MTLVGKRLSHYDILEELGTGGMGVVYLARDVNLLRNVAIKTLPDAFDNEKKKQRFIQEARAASALNHPSIVGIYDFGRDQDVDFIVMEYIEGKSLAEKLSLGALPASAAVDYAAQVAGAMTLAHEAGIIHRDLKPHNIMVTRAGQIKILDFGIVKLSAATDMDWEAVDVQTVLTGQGHVVGTLAYMSPEQAVGEKIDNRSDIFSLGIVLYEMLTGALPFEGDSERSILRRLHFDTPEPIASLVDDVPPGLEKIVQTALAKHPEHRQQSMEQLKQQLEALDLEAPPPEEGSSEVVTRELPAPGAVMESVETGESKPEATLSKVFMTLAKKPKRSLFGLTALIIVLAVVAASVLTGVLKGDTKIPTAIDADLLAVLPVENIGDEKELETACTGLTESLTNGLSQVQEFKETLKVVPSTEVRQSGVKSAKQVAKEFGAGLVIATSLQQLNEEIRMDVSLIKGGTQLAAATGVVTNEEQGTLQRQALLKTVGLLRGVIEQEEKGQPKTVATTSKQNASDFYLKGMGLLKERIERSDKAEILDQAVEAFQRALALDPNSAPAYAGLSRAYWRKYVASNKDPMLLKQAFENANRAVELNKDLSVARVSLGLALHRKGQFAEAAKELETALVLDPVSADAFAGLGEVFESQSEFEKAERFYINALNLRPRDTDLLEVLGNLYFRIGNYKKAEEAFIQSTEIAPKSFVALRKLATAYYMQGKQSQAATNWQKALEIKADPILYSNLGTMHFFNGRYTDAVSSFKKAVELPGGANDYRLWVYLADAYRWTPDNQSKSVDAYRVAIGLIEEELKKHPDDPTLNSFLAVSLAKKGEIGRALTKLKQITKKEINEPQINYDIAVAFEVVGRRKAALESLIQAIKLGFPREDVRADPELIKLRQDPEFHTIIAKLQKEERDSAKEGEH